VERVLVISQIMVAQGCNIAEEYLVAQRHNISEGQTYPLISVSACLPVPQQERGALHGARFLYGGSQLQCHREAGQHLGFAKSHQAIQQCLFHSLMRL
jgi:hypothetical protein